MKRVNRICTLGVLAAAMLAACSSVEIDPAVVQSQITPQVTVEEHRNALPISNALVLFNKNTNLLGGWNHVANFPDEFAGLKFPSGMYRIDRKPALDHGVHQYSTTLIKKYGDWHHQHANGITAQYSAVPFANVAGIEMVIRINSDISNLPNRKEIAKTYEDLVPKSQLEKLDDGQVHLSIALVGEGAESVETPTFNADYLLSLDAKKQTDEWLHIFIPATDLTRFSEVNYNQTPVSAEQANSIPVTSLRLMAETSSTKVIRNLIPNNFDANTPKLFKEIGVELQYLAVVKKI